MRPADARRKRIGVKNEPSKPCKPSVPGGGWKIATVFNHQDRGGRFDFSAPAEGQNLKSVTVTQT